MGQSRNGETAKAFSHLKTGDHDGFQRHVMGTRDGPVLGLFKQDRADKTDDGILIGEDAEHRGPPLDCGR